MAMPHSMEISSFGKVEKMNHTLKKNRAKLCQETHLHWDQALPTALLRIRVAPQSRLQWSLHETVYKPPFQAVIGAGDMYTDQEVKVKNCAIFKPEVSCN